MNNAKDSPANHNTQAPGVDNVQAKEQLKNVKNFYEYSRLKLGENIESMKDDPGTFSISYTL